MDATPYCQAHPTEIIPMKDNCAHYIDCTRVLAGVTADPVSECTYPDLFSTLSMTCQAFTTVQCDSRPEPMAPCTFTVIFSIFTVICIHELTLIVISYKLS